MNCVGDECACNDIDLDMTNNCTDDGEGWVAPVLDASYSDVCFAPPIPESSTGSGGGVSTTTSTIIIVAVVLGVVGLAGVAMAAYTRRGHKDRRLTRMSMVPEPPRDASASHAEGPTRTSHV